MWLLIIGNKILINNHQKERFAKNILDKLYKNISDKKIAFLDGPLKKDTNDSRESASIYVAKSLIEEEAKISVYDPKVKEKKVLNDLKNLNCNNNIKYDEKVNVHSDPYLAAKDSHAIAILTEWDEFKTYDWKIFSIMKKPAFIFDGRNIINAKKLEKLGFIPYSIGKVF